MKRIVLCFDGTWNRPDDDERPEDRVETNVKRFYDAIPKTGDDGVKQVAWYNKGVGTHWWDKFAGGIFGAGLDLHIIEGYRELMHQYEEDDQVYILGFSRGAYTARSLVGLLRKCGLAKGLFKDVTALRAYQIYRLKGGDADSPEAVKFRRDSAREVPIHFVGVWDTVGALGIPLDLADKLNVNYYKFHDTGLSKMVSHAYHAIALDEHRVDYDVTLWDTPPKPGQTVEQRWFIGAHADVGGGYETRLLSDITLRWMQDRARAAGLTVNLLAPGAENFKGDPTDSYGQFLKGLYKKVKPRYRRKVMQSPSGTEKIDPTVDQRRRAVAGYRPENLGLPELLA